MSDDFDRGYKAGFRDGRGTTTKKAAAGEEEKLTVAHVKKMTSAEINSRWDEVLPLLEAQGPRGGMARNTSGVGNV